MILTKGNLKSHFKEVVHKTSITQGILFKEIKPKKDDFDFKGVDTQYSTHKLHTYLAAMNPPLANKLISKYFLKSGKLLDPFCGGGAVLVEGILSGLKTYGSDINSLAVLISKVKTHYIPSSDLISLSS
ncbi:hypothetical protein ACFL56_03075, partial [Candidatus Margulisiibacteriota bacterium]